MGCIVSKKAERVEPEAAMGQAGGSMPAPGMPPTGQEQASAASDKATKDAEAEAKYQAAIEEAEQVELPEGSTWHENGGAELEPLLAFTTLVCVRWLLKFAKGEVMPERKGVVPAWQQLPKEAEVKVEQLRASKWMAGLPVGVLSYGWASRRHPDPTGEQLKRLIPLLEAIVKECDKIGGPTFTWGILWDFMSLPQRGYTIKYDENEDDRTQPQQLRFGSGLFYINVWYGAKYTHTLVLNTPMPAGAENVAAYAQRGWCIFERMLSSVVKDDYCYLELDKMDGAKTDWGGIRKQCSAGRPAPMAPDAFEQMIREGMDREKKEADSGIRFTNGKDATEVVIPQYKRGFLRLMGQASGLSYGRLNWGDREAQTLAAALVYAHAHGALAQLTVRSHTPRPEACGLAGVGCAPSPWLCVWVWVC